ncbi:MAG: HEAT repeat domain-containing protein [Phycisphaerae bacterium]
MPDDIDQQGGIADDDRSDQGSLDAETADQSADMSEIAAGMDELADDDALWSDAEAMSVPMLARLFGVPFMIVSFIVGGAILVVFLFGGPVLSKERTVDDLLAALEGTSGEKSAGILPPREKQLWQTALELSKRLQNRESEFTESELLTITERLSVIIRADLEHRDTFPTFGDERAKQQQVRISRLQFAIRALGKTGREEAIDPLLSVVETGLNPFVQVAIQELGNLYELPAAARSVGPIKLVMASSSNAEVLLSATTALSILGDGADRDLIEALDRVCVSQEGEVSWSAALALARLGSAVGKSTMYDLLDREFWESGERYTVIDESGAERRYRMPPHRVESLMVAAIDAASQTSDTDLWELIEGLKSDPSPIVRGRAVTVLERRADASGAGQSGGVPAGSNQE